MHVKRACPRSSRCLFWQVLFGPGTDGGLTLSAVGAGLFRTYRYQDQALKLQTGSLGRKEAQNFTAHAWVVEGARRHIST